MWNRQEPFILISSENCCCCLVSLEDCQSSDTNRESVKKGKHGKVKSAGKGQGKSFKCPDCDYQNVKQSKMIRHLRMHSGHKPFKCPSCQYESNDKSKIRRHYVTHTREKPFQCELCGSKFTQSGSLKTHLTNVHGLTKVEFRCPFCPKLVTSNIGELRNHIKSYHDSTNYPLIVNKVNNVTLLPLSSKSQQPVNTISVEGQSTCSQLISNEMEFNFSQQSCSSTSTINSAFE